MIGNSLFILVYLALCFHNRIAIDDFYFLSLAKEFDPIEAMIVERSAWSARWPSVLLDQIVLSFHPSRWYLFLFGSMAMFLFILSVDRILRRLFSPEDRNTDRWMRLHLSIFIVSAIFHSTFSIGQTWFWLCSACTYLIGAIMLLLGISTFIGRKHSGIDMIICCIAFLYVGGSSEPLAVFVLAVLLLLLLLPRSRSAIPLRTLVIAFASCLIGFAILYSAEGNFKRASHFQDISIAHAALLNVKMSALIILRELPSILPVVVLFSIPIGLLLARRKVFATGRRELWGRILPILFLFLASIYFFQLPITFATQDLGADRTLFPLVIFAIAAFVWTFLHLRPILDRSRVPTVRSALFAAMLLNGYTLIDQLKVLPAYASAYDERMEMLEGMTETTGTIIVDPLPPSGLLLSAEISTDPSYFANQHLRLGLGLKAQVIKADPSTIDPR